MTSLNPNAVGPIELSPALHPEFQPARAIPTTVVAQRGSAGLQDALMTREPASAGDIRRDNRQYYGKNSRPLTANLPLPPPLAHAILSSLQPSAGERRRDAGARPRHPVPKHGHNSRNKLGPAISSWAFRFFCLQSRFGIPRLPPSPGAPGFASFRDLGSGRCQSCRNPGLKRRQTRATRPPRWNFFDLWE
jgi:hypothetical protein